MSVSASPAPMPPGRKGLSGSVVSVGSKSQWGGVTNGFAFTLTPCLTWDDGGNLGGWGELLRRFGDCCEAGPWESCGRLSAGALVRLGRRGPRTVPAEHRHGPAHKYLSDLGDHVAQTVFPTVRALDS